MHDYHHYSTTKTEFVETRAVGKCMISPWVAQQWTKAQTQACITSHDWTTKFTAKYLLSSSSGCCPYPSKHCSWYVSHMKRPNNSSNVLLFQFFFLIIQIAGREIKARTPAHEQAAHSLSAFWPWPSMSSGNVQFPHEQRCLLYDNIWQVANKKHTTGIY